MTKDQITEAIVRGLPVRGRERPENPPDLGAVSLVARLGGCLNRKKDGTPGNRTFLERYARLVVGAQTIERIAENGEAGTSILISRNGAEAPGQARVGRVLRPPDNRIAFRSVAWWLIPIVSTGCQSEIGTFFEECTTLMSLAISLLFRKSLVRISTSLARSCWFK